MRGSELPVAVAAGRETVTVTVVLIACFEPYTLRPVVPTHTHIFPFIPSCFRWRRVSLHTN